MNAEQALKLVLGSSVVYAIVAACGGSSGGGAGGHDGGPVHDAMADVNQSGSRLKAQYYVGTDGSKSFAGMYDSQTKQDCAYATASDGTNRCLPAGPHVIASTAYFSDASCKVPILNVPKDCTTPPPYVTTFQTMCGGTTQFSVFPSGAAFTPGVSVYLGTGSGSTAMCMMIKASDVKGAWVGVGAELAPSTFVQGNLEAE